MGVPWIDQELGSTLPDFLVEVRKNVIKCVADGHFSIKDADHNSDNYSNVGISNKRITIVAGLLDPSIKDRSSTMLERWQIVLRTVLG
jgi:hypothetical protein